MELASNDGYLLQYFVQKRIKVIVLSLRLTLRRSRRKTGYRQSLSSLAAKRLKNLLRNMTG